MTLLADDVPEPRDVTVVAEPVSRTLDLDIGLTRATEERDGSAAPARSPRIRVDAAQHSPFDAVAITDWHRDTPREFGGL